MRCKKCSSGDKTVKSGLVTQASKIGYFGSFVFFDQGTFRLGCGFTECLCSEIHRPTSEMASKNGDRRGAQSRSCRQGNKYKHMW